MVDEKLKQLVLRLHQRSKEGTISWTPTLEEEAFDATFPTYTLRIERKVRRDGAPDIIITITNDQGREVESFSDEDLEGYSHEDAPGGSWFGFLREIYETARRQALKADEAIDFLLKELG